jgi:hypothetical protein
LEFADESLKKDKEVVLAALQNNSYAYSYVDEMLKKDPDVVKLSPR